MPNRRLAAESKTNTWKSERLRWLGSYHEKTNENTLSGCNTAYERKRHQQNSFA